VTQVLSVTSECVPLVKTGGLADVAGALPGALAGQSVTMKTLLPGYPAVLDHGPMGPAVAEFHGFGGKLSVQPMQAGGLDMLVLVAPHLYARRGGPYLDTDGRDYADNPERFAALSYVAAALAETGAGGWRPDILHCHDWQAGLAPLYARQLPAARRPASVLTVHNIAFHGLAPAERIAGLRLPLSDFTPRGYEFYGQVSALKAGLVYGDRITTVSPTYARELTTPAFGMGLDGVIRQRAGDLTGILNGIDTATWDPRSDPAVHAYRGPAGKARNRAALLDEFGLPETPGPLAIVVSRLSEQKGLDLLADAVPELLQRGGALALLGSGDAGLEARWRALAGAHDRVAVKIGYDEALSHRMMAGADAILVPSRFEPCGLTQLYGLRYGTLPVVTRTGGLADTVIDANAAALSAGCATGLQFAPGDGAALSAALTRLCDLFGDGETWRRMQQNAMHHPVGWDRSAAAYAALYEELVAAK